VYVYGEKRRKIVKKQLLIKKTAFRLVSDSRLKVILSIQNGIFMYDTERQS